MSFDLLNQEDPREWVSEQRNRQFDQFAGEEVVGSHCESCQYDPNPVIKRGSLEADLMVVGDYTAPADRGTDKPFSGPAGELLHEMLAAIDRDWEEDCYVTNALLCDGTDEAPRVDSVRSCHVNLDRQIEIVSPRVILGAGKHALQSLYERPSSTRLRDHLGAGGSIPGYPWIQGVISFNPAYILRQPEGSEKRTKLKRLAWQHLQTVDELLAREDP